MVFQVGTRQHGTSRRSRDTNMQLVNMCASELSDSNEDNDKLKDLPTINNAVGAVQMRCSSC